MDQIEAIKMVNIEITTTYRYDLRSHLYTRRDELIRSLLRQGKARYIRTERDSRGVEFHLYKVEKFYVHSKVYFGFQKKVISDKPVNHLGSFYFKYLIGDKYPSLAV